MPLWRFLGAPWVLLSGAKKPLRALYCSEMLFFRFKKAPAGMLLLRDVIFYVQKKPAECVFPRKTEKNDVLGYWGSRIFKSRVFLDGKQLTRTARPGPVFPVHRKPLRRRGAGAGLA